MRKFYHWSILIITMIALLPADLHAQGHTFVFDSVQHVRCPDGDLNNYPNDGAFSVHLTDSAQYYQQITVHSSHYLFYDQTFNSNFRLTGLAAATYYVTAYGMDGSTFADSIVIEKPAPWVSNVIHVDTVCPGDTGSAVFSHLGGTPPYTFNWYFDEDTLNGVTVSLVDTTLALYGMEGGGRWYRYNIHDSRGCNFFGEEIADIVVYLWEYAMDMEIVGDTVHRVCEGTEIPLVAQSFAPGIYTWCYGGVCDSSNANTYTDLEGNFVSGFFTPPVTESGWVTVSFDNMSPCPKPRDSVWVEVAPPIWIEMDTVLKKDTTYTIYFHPFGGRVYLDEVLVSSYSSGWMTLNTGNLTASEHLMTYIAESDLHCDNETQNVLFRVVSPAEIPERNIHVNVYPNPVADVLHVSQTADQELTLTITDMMGKQIRQFSVFDSSTDLNVADLRAGVYMLHVQDATGASTTVKLIKK